MHLLLDRSLSPAGARYFKDLRCQGHGAEFAWPSPGVFSIPQFATRLLQAYKKGFHPSALSSLEVFAALVKHFPQYSCREIAQRIKAIKNFYKIGADPECWHRILKEFSSENSLNFNDWQQNIIFYLTLKKLQQNGDFGQAPLSNWEYVEQAIEYLREGAPPLPWSTLCERDPFLNLEDLEFHAAAYREPFPLEQMFLQALGKHVQVRVHKPLSVPESFHFVRELPRIDPSNEIIAGASLHWAFQGSTPLPFEVAALVPGKGLIDLPEYTAGTLSPLLHRSLTLYFDYWDEDADSSHFILREKAYAEELEKIGLHLNEFPPENIFYQLLERFHQAESHSIHIRFQDALLKTPSSSTSFTNLFMALQDLGYLSVDESQNPLPLRASARGIPFLGLEDAPLSGAQEIILWSDLENLESLCNEESFESSTSRLFPAKLMALLNAEGFAVPDSTKEASLFCAWLYELREHIKVLSSKSRPKSNHTSRFPIFEALPPSSSFRLSPSQLESYLSCPQLWYLERHLKLSPSPEWDKLSAADFGSWIHKALELFLKNPDWEEPHTRLFEIMRSSVSEVFLNPMTPSFRKLFDRESHYHLEKVVRHIKDFEFELYKTLPGRTVITESSVSRRVFDIDFYGKIDRIDKVESQSSFALMWDYKTGTIEGRHPLSQIKQGKVQWFLYKELIEAELGIPVIGGGYLNPLEAHRSRLFLYPWHEAATDVYENLVSLLERCGHPYTIMTRDEELATKEALKESVYRAQKGLALGRVDAAPLKSTQCFSCRTSSICAYPYLQSKHEVSSHE